MKHTGQESGGELYEILKCWSFLQSKCVTNVCKLLQRQPLPGAPAPTGGLASSSPLVYSLPQMKISGVANVYQQYTELLID